METELWVSCGLDHAGPVADSGVDVDAIGEIAFVELESESGVWAIRL